MSNLAGIAKLLWRKTPLLQEYMPDTTSMKDQLKGISGILGQVETGLLGKTNFVQESVSNLTGYVRKKDVPKVNKLLGISGQKGYKGKELFSDYLQPLRTLAAWNITEGTRTDSLASNIRTHFHRFS
jgi:hypothetical protein